MSQIQLNFNANNYQPQWAGGGGNLGLGKHPVVIVGAETKPTNKGDGGMLVFKVTAIDGPAKGQSQDIRLNLWNPSQTAVEIANKQLSAICHAVKTYDVPVPNVLFNKPFVIENGPGSDPRYVEVVGVSDMSGGQPGGQQPQQPPQAPQQQQGGYGQPDPNQGGYGQQPQQQGGGFTPPNQGGGFTPPGGPANNGGGFQPPGNGGAPNGGFTPPGNNGGFTPPNGGGAPQGAGGFTPPGGGAQQGGWGPR